ncbi:MAG TPA: hypothetical protein VGJ60_07225 [Chloroflexota bacterium]|jgi:hypothetical protein
MPNHCESDLIVTGPAEQIDEFLAKHVVKDDGTVLDLNTIRPYPQELAELDRAEREWSSGYEAARAAAGEGDSPLPRELSMAVYQEYVRQHGERPKDGFNSGGYDWCVKNWGTKWGCYHQGYTGKPPLRRTSRGRVELHFSTAWGPFDTGLLEEVSTKFPALKFKMDSYERGMGFQCHVVVEGGEIADETSGDYHGSRGG